MKTTIQKVTGCRNCPFSYVDEGGQFWCHNLRKVKVCELKEVLNMNEKPKFCPLKKKSVLVQLEV